GKTDLLFQNASRQAAGWFMNGTNFVSATLLRDGIAPVAGWSIAGTGDFNGDQQPDLVWSHTDGRVAVWQFIGTTFIGAATLRSTGPAESSGWKIRGIGDFNFDGS